MTATCRNTGAEPAVDCNLFLSTFGTDDEAREELVDLFLRVSRQQMSVLAEARIASDWGRVAREAHSLKGSLGIFGARPAIRLIELMESACEQMQTEVICTCLAELESCMAVVSEEVQALHPRLKFSAPASM